MLVSAAGPVDFGQGDAMVDDACRRRMVDQHRRVAISPARTAKVQ
jgi:hypothetical protein